VTVVGICAVWEAVRLLQEWRVEEEEEEEEAAADALPQPPVPRMRRLLTCALLRWSCFTFLTLSLIFFRLRFNDHKPARCLSPTAPRRMHWQPPLHERQSTSP
jgi:hypothetical protein